MPSTARFCPNAPTCVVRVSGEDALPFLQGQFTQDINRLEPNGLAYGLWLNQKGKVVGDSFILREEKEYLLISFGTPAETILQRLEAYIIADDVGLQNCSDQWAGLSIMASAASALRLSEKFPFPATGRWTKVGTVMVLHGRQSRGPNWYWLYPIGTAQPEWINQAPFEPANIEAFEHARIADGIPRVPQDVGPGDLPNEAKLEGDAISYSKGCYLGQEVMARLKSSGQVRRNLLRVRGEGVMPVLPAPLFAGDKQVGEIRSVATDINGFIGLAMLSLIPLGQKTRVALAAGGEENLVLVDRIE